MDLEKLSKIESVDVNPFLFTRIKQKIAQNKTETVSTKVKLFASLSFAVLLVFNVLVFTNYKAKQLSTQSYAESIQLINNNSLYE